MLAAPFMSETREVMNIRQASQYLGVSPDMLYKYAHAGKVPAFKLGSRWRFMKSKLDRWMEEKSTIRRQSCRSVGTRAQPRPDRPPKKGFTQPA